jgi:antitoxin MazE
MVTGSLNIETTVGQWGNGLGVRITRAVAGIAGFTEGTPITLHADNQQIVIKKIAPRPSLDDMLAAFDRKRHGGEAMAFTPIGAEVIK